MNLPINPPLAPMEAQLTEHLPSGPQWLYEPKWDGFRCIVFRDGSETILQSKSGKPLERYFPELVEAIGRLAASTFILDGEIIVPIEGVFSFDDLLQRIHPAASRINRLARERPARLIVFDLLADQNGVSLLDKPLSERRPRLEQFAKRYLNDLAICSLSVATRNEADARRWLEAENPNLDGVMAKQLDIEYRPGDRSAMKKIKKMRTADCVVGGFRYSTSSYANGTLVPQEDRQIGSLLLGLYNSKGLLDHVGFCSGLNARERRMLVGQLEPLIQPPGFTGGMPGGPSRWSTERSAQWQPLAPQLVVEVRWDHFTGGRFRHGTRLLRWRPDKPPESCTMDQIFFNRPGEK